MSTGGPVKRNPWAGKPVKTYSVIRTKSGRWSWYCNEHGCDAYQSGIDVSGAAERLAQRHWATTHPRVTA